MEEAQRLLNPWVLHLQKLGLELKCPLCLQLFNRPMLLPCNHIFCSLCMPKTVELGSECPACKHQYVDREVKPAPFIENIVNIYRNIDATFNANIFHTVRSDVTRVSAQSPASINIDVNINSENENIEIVQSGNSSNGQSTRQVAADKHMETVRHSPKRPIHNDANGSHPESNTSQTVEVKRQKKTNDGLNNTSAVLDLKRSPCAFCHSSEESEGSGPLVSYAQGKEVVGNVANFSKVTHVHEKCTQWAPQIYFKDGKIHGLESELARASKLKCNSCGEKGAVLGCYMKSCKKTFHVPCAYDIYECRWDEVNFLMLCPSHTHIRFPGEKKSKAVKQETEKKIFTNLNPCTTQLNAKQDLVLCGSALSPEEKSTLIEFTRSNGAIVSRLWRPNVTHVIAAIDSNGACTRTLKVLMGILNGKWIVTVEWIKACVKAGSLVNEEPYEVHLDTHGCSGGPKAGRLRVLNNGPKLFVNLKFYFVGEFVQAFKADLLNLVTTGGGTIIEDKNQLMCIKNETDEDVKWVSLVVYNADVFGEEDSVKVQKLNVAEEIARESRAQIVGHTWILESIAGCKLLPFASTTHSNCV